MLYYNLSKKTSHYNTKYLEFPDYRELFHYKVSLRGFLIGTQQ